MSEPMGAFAAAFRDLCRFRAGPQDLPYSPTLLGVFVVLEMACSLIAGQYMATAEFPATPVRTVVAVLLAQAGIYAVLALRQKTARFVQTALAWNGVVLVFDLCTVPVLALIGRPSSDPNTASPLQLALSWPLLFIFVWVFTALVRTMRDAAEVRTGAAVLLTLTLMFVAPLLAAL